MKKFLLLLCVMLGISITMHAQEKTITGKVTDDKGNPLSGASVVVKGSTTGTSTNPDGTFTLKVPANAKQIEISSVGKESRTINIGNAAHYDVSLNIADQSLTEVIIVGYQKVTKKDIPGSVVNVGGKEVAQKPIGSFTQLLQGKSTGVQVTGQSGRPGSNGYIRIRGTGSINATNEPLILLDGTPISSVAYSMLNPNDIEEVSILKDASSQAIYGSRAANGVILVTTKRGRGKLDVRYSFQNGYVNAQDLKNLRFMTGREKLQYEYEAGFTNQYLDTMILNRIASGAFAAGSDLFNLSEQNRTGLWDLLESRSVGDWSQYLLQKNANVQTHEIAVSGSSDKFRYYFSVNKSDNDGVMYGSYWNKKGGRINAEFNASESFKMGSNIGVTYSRENNVRNLYNTQNAYAALFIFNNYEPLYQSNGKYNNTHTGYSPIEGTDHNPSVLNRLSTFASVFGDLMIVKDLNFRSQLGINYNTLSQENYLQPNSNLANILGFNQKTDAGNSDFTYVFSNTLGWKKTIASNHNLSLLTGMEFTKNKFYSYTLSSRGMPTSTVTTQDNAGSPQTATTSRSDWAVLSYIAAANYNFKEKYFVNLSGRRDGSSRFGANKRFANFWAIGVQWDLLKENFIHANFLSQLRLRASMGTTGTVPSGLYDNLGTYALTAKYNNAPAAVPARLPNADLTWEENKKKDIGLDFGLFQNRLTGTIDLYHRKTNGLIYPKNVSYTTGFSGYQSNIGNITNKGFEIMLSGDVLQYNGGKLNLFGSYSNNANKITNLYSDDVPQTLSRFKIGEPVYTYFMVRWAGVNPSTGRNMYYTKDGQLTETYSSSDAVLLSGKTPQVKYYGSFGLQATYKGFELSTQFYYSGGNYIMNYVYSIGASEGESVPDQQYAEALHYWKKPGDIVRYANLNDPSQRITYDSDKYLEKGDYVSLRDVTLAYTTPSIKVTEKFKIKSLRFYVQGTNLAIWTKFKGLPEVGEANNESGLVSPGLYNLFAQPQLRAITTGIDIRF